MKTHPYQETNTVSNRLVHKLGTVEALKCIYVVHHNVTSTLIHSHQGSFDTSLTFGTTAFCKLNSDNDNMNIDRVIPLFDFSKSDSDCVIVHSDHGITTLRI